MIEILLYDTYKSRTHQTRGYAPLVLKTYRIMTVVCRYVI
jgi:hypothetical protein